ncbi:metalloendopeptidase [Puteibacter caeruleilacunae]|nr:metalloendopeptidase [Puteibacter caeruleilacunae]
MKRIVPIGIVIVLLIVVAFFIGKRFGVKQEERIVGEIIDSLEVAPTPVLKYGIPVDSFALQSDVVGRNESLGKILGKLGVSGRTIHKIAKLSKSTFDVRKIKRGNNWVGFFEKDSMMALKYWVYEIDKTDYIVYELKDSLTVTTGQKEVQVVLKEATGTIESSFWNAMVDNGVNPLLSNKLSDIYAWSIDFFGIKKGDQFKVIYEENYVDSVPIGLGKIQAALINHMGKDYWGIRFKNGEKMGYYDEEGQNLQKAFLKAPLKYSRVSSGFSYARKHPVLKIVRPHLGVDYAAATGTPVRSIGDGVVTKRAYQRRGAGNYVEIKHNGVYKTQYMHLNGFAKGIKAGVRVEQGQVIGYVGRTGLATGPHLDFRVFRNGHAINPLKMESPSGDSITVNLMPRFKTVSDSVVKRLQAINKNQISNPAILDSIPTSDIAESVK